MSKANLGVATVDGVSVMRPDSEGTSYSLISKGLAGRQCSCILRAGDGRLTVGTDNFFVQMSTDGMEWKPSMEGISRPHITALARHPKHAHLLFAGTCPPAVYMSSDQGKTWNVLSPLESLPSATSWSYSEAPYRARVTAIACHAEYNGVVFAAINSGGLAASEDGGKTWANRDDGLPPAITDLIIPAGGGRRIYAGTEGGFFRSDDLAGTWQDYSKGLPFTRVRAMAVAPSNPNLLILSVAHRTSGASALAMTKDGGESWEVATEGLPDLTNHRQVTSLCFGAGGFYAGTSQGDLFFLGNLEGRWTRMGANLPAVNGLVALN